MELPLDQVGAMIQNQTRCRGPRFTPLEPLLTDPLPDQPRRVVTADLPAFAAQHVPDLPNSLDRVVLAVDALDLRGISTLIAQRPRRGRALLGGPVTA